jgi:type I restriction enzyme S subunit
MNTFISKINEVRDILRKEGITGMNSITHCVAFYILRNLSNELCIKLAIDNKYSYEKFNKDDDGTTLLCKDKLFEKFYKLNSSDCFVSILLNKFKYKPIKNFAIKTSLYLERIFKCFETINTEQLNINYDIVGVIYEIHLATGATGQGMRDLGQYFTHRKVIKYMVELCDPKVKSNGTIETILDPSMGTGGFLTMATKHLSANNTNINWNLQQSNIYGFDVDENLKSLAYINLLLENNEIFENIRVQDTLCGDFKINDIIIDKYDVILANEPFGLKNIVHAECCRRVVDLKIRGTKAEPLFLQLMMISLNQNGRCAVIVPDGVLFNDAKLHKDTRKYLIENLNLEKIVGMEDDTFMNTGVKSSILYFVNNGTTKNVKFCKIKLVNNEVVEETIKTVSKDIIVSKDYSLFINKYIQSNIVKLSNVEYKNLGDICDFLPSTKHNSSIGLPLGNYRFYNSSQDNKLYLNTFEINKQSIIIGNGGNLCIHLDTQFTASKHVSVIQIKNELEVNLNISYIYYYILKNQILLTEKSAGATISWLNRKSIGEIQIPIPPLEIQNQIITVLDNDYLIIKNASELIKMYEEKKKGIVWSNTINTRIEKLGNVCEVKQGTYITQDMKIEGIYPLYGGGDISYYINTFNRENDIIIAKDGVSLDCVRYEKGKFFLNHHGWSINCKDIIYKMYLYYYLFSNQNKIYSLAMGSAQKGINQKNFYDIEIPIPSLEIQQDIVKQCEHYDNLINILKKQIEDIEKENTIVKVLQSLHTV